MSYISFQPNDYFNTKLYTGNGSAGNSITGVGFQPDLIWIKNRTNTESHALFDAVRGVTKRLHPNVSGVEETNANTVTAFGTDGFTVGTNPGINGNGISTVAWNWKANGQGSSNTDGSITSTVSASATSGFSIVKYTGTGSNATVGHGLGVVPNIVLVKRLDATSDWRMYHSAAGAGSPATKQLFLNTTGAEDDDNTIWNDTAPTSSLFTVGTNTGGNASGGTYVAYCFAQKSGFSSMGSYTGNGSTDGTFVYTNGMKPAFVIIKGSSNTENWHMYDNKRDTGNPTDQALQPNTTSAEFTETNVLDFLSNGFKLRVSGAGHNGSGVSYIYMAFGEEPLVSSNGVPAVAR